MGRVTLVRNSQRRPRGPGVSPPREVELRAEQGHASQGVPVLREHLARHGLPAARLTRRG